MADIKAEIQKKQGEMDALLERLQALTTERDQVADKIPPNLKPSVDKLFELDTERGRVANTILKCRGAIEVLQAIEATEAKEK